MKSLQPLRRLCTLAYDGLCSVQWAWPSISIARLSMTYCMSLCPRRKQEHCHEWTFKGKSLGLIQGFKFVCTQLELLPQSWVIHCTVKSVKLNVLQDARHNFSHALHFPVLSLSLSVLWAHFCTHKRPHMDKVRCVQPHSSSSHIWAALTHKDKLGNGVSRKKNVKQWAW